MRVNWLPMVLDMMQFTCKNVKRLTTHKFIFNRCITKKIVQSWLTSRPCPNLNQSCQLPMLIMIGNSTKLADSSSVKEEHGPPHQRRTRFMDVPLQMFCTLLVLSVVMKIGWLCLILPSSTIGRATLFTKIREEVSPFLK